MFTRSSLIIAVLAVLGGTALFPALVAAQEGVPITRASGPGTIERSPWALRLEVGIGHISGTTQTDYHHPNPALPNRGHFAGSAYDVTATLWRVVCETCQVGLSIAGTRATDLGTSGQVERTWINGGVLGRASAVAAWAPGGGPVLLDGAAGIAVLGLAGAVAGIADPQARFKLEDASGIGPQGSVGLTFLQALGKSRIHLGASLRATATKVWGNSVETTAWLGTAALALQL